MANIKISELNELETKNSEDLLAIVDTNNNETKKIKVKTLAPENFELYAIADTQPTIPAGESYYNTTSNKIFTNVGGIYVDKGEPKKGILYIVFEEQTTYAYNGTTLVSVGGGASGGGSLEIGTIVPFAGSTAPDSFLMCDGSAVSRTTYSDLFAVISTTYGAGDGSTTFNLPNLKGRVPVGLDGTQTEFDTLGETGGSKYLQYHTHQLNGGSGNMYYTAGGENTWVPKADENEYKWGTGGPIDVTTGNSGNLQPYLVVNYIIKAFNTTTLQEPAEVVNTYSESPTDAYSCDYINTQLNNKANAGQVLWTNPNPTSAFDSQTITLSTSDWDYCEIIYKNYMDSDTFEVQRFFKDYMPSEIGGTFYYNNNLYTGTRKVTSANNGLQIGFGYVQGIQIGQAILGADLKWIVPQKIIGYKN